MSSTSGMSGEHRARSHTFLTGPSEASQSGTASSTMAGEATKGTKRKKKRLTTAEAEEKKREQMARLDKADLALTRARRRWFLAVLLLLVVVLGLQLGIAVLCFMFKGKINIIVNEDLAGYDAVMESTRGRAVGQLALTDSIMGAAEWTKTQAQRDAKAAEVEAANDLGLQKLQELLDNMDLHSRMPTEKDDFIRGVEKRIDQQKAMKPVEAQAARDGPTAFYPQGGLYFYNTNLLTSSYYKMKAGLDEAFPADVDDAQSVLDMRLVLAYTALGLTVLTLVVLLLARRAITRRRRMLHGALKKSRRRIEKLLQSEMISVDVKEEDAGASAGEASATDADDLEAGALRSEMSMSLSSGSWSSGSKSTGSFMSSTEKSVSFSGDSNYDGETPYGDMRRQQRAVKRGVRRARKLVNFALALLFVLMTAVAVTAVLLHDWQSSALSDVRSIGPPLLVDTGSLRVSIQDRITSLIFATKSNLLVESDSNPYGIPRATFKLLGDTHIMATAASVAAAQAAIEAAQTNITDKALKAEVDAAASRLNAPWDNTTATKDNTDSIEYMMAYQTAGFEIAMEGNFTDGPHPVLTTEQEDELIALLTDAEFTANRERTDAHTVTLEEAAQRFIEDQADEWKSQATVAGALVGVLFALGIATMVGVAIGTRNLQQQTRVRWNTQVWSLQRVLGDEECCRLFRAFVEKQMCVEQLDFIQKMDGLHFRVLGLKYQDAMQLLRYYLVEGAPNEVNVSSPMRKLCSDAIKAEDEKQTDPEDFIMNETLTCFRQAYEECCALVSANSLTPFVTRSPEFAKFDEERQRDIEREVALLNKHRDV
ncbi:MAG: hypothetical protein MHM6MM_000296 [Cercozoa sp. M6MM]